MTPAERKAVGFFALLAAAGAAGRALGIGDTPGGRPAAADRLALQHQLDAVDSAHARKERGGRHAGKGRGHARTTAPRVGADSGVTTTASAPHPRAPRATAHAARTPEPPAAPVDVNTADSVALEALPGIGPALAHRILVDRAVRGGYASLADFGRVPGIGPGLERRLAGAVTFTGSGRPSPGPPPPPAVVRGDGRRGEVPRGARGWPAP